MEDSDSVVELPDLECWDRLRAQQFGRLAYHLLNEVHIVPLNFAVHGKDVFFRSAEGDKLLGVLMNSDVALEIDEVTDRTAWSVVARGHARILREDEQHLVATLPLRSWIDTPKHDVVVIRVTSITGREFVLDRRDLEAIG